MASTSRSRSNSRPSKHPRQNVDLDLCGRGSDTPTPDSGIDNDGWAEPANVYGEVDLNNLSVFNRIGVILENLEPNGPTDVMCYFKAFIDDIMFQLMADETNRYAEQVKAAHPTFYHLTDWKPATVQDIRTMLGLLFTMG